MSSGVCLVSKDTDLVRHFEGGRAAVPSTKGSAPVVFVIDSEDSQQAVKIFEKAVQQKRKAGEPFYAIISNTACLKKTVSQIDGITVSLNGHATKDVSGSKEDAVTLSQLLEGRLSDFVRKMKHGPSNNVYDFLITECERTIFDIALKESNGNQIRAARFLGVNRNTLSKKIKAFKIAVRKQNKKAR